jgi:hypothetical protein
MGMCAYRQHPSPLWMGGASLGKARRRHSCSYRLVATEVTVFVGFITLLKLHGVRRFMLFVMTCVVVE